MLYWLGRGLRQVYRWATYRLYAEFAWAYDLVSWVVSLGAWSRWRLLALDYVPGGRVLEVGFGTGELLVEMASRGWPVVGLDASPAMQRIAGRKLRRRGLHAGRVCALAQAMPFPGGCFDAILSTFPAEYILEGETLAEFARLLCLPVEKAGGGSGRVVIVGLFVEPALRREAATSAPIAGFLHSFLQRAQAAGLQPKLLYRRVGWARLPVLLLEIAE
ncbi:MAG: class I SAM-dependent methyltransferase [Anaerolineales bacterium]|nr:class I SAM-dependent methyltransferase [Anaerolineales bacterium]